MRRSAAARIQRLGHGNGQPLAAFTCQNAIHQRGEYDGGKRQGRNGHAGDGRQRRARTRPDLEGFALRGHRAQAGFHRRRDSRARRHSAHLDDPLRELAFLHPAHLLGWRAGTLGGGSGRRFLRLGLGKIRTDFLPGGVRQPPQRPQFILGNALSEVGQNYHGEHRYRAHDPVLPG